MQTTENHREVQASIFSMISEELMVPAERLTLSTDFKKDLEVDSLRAIEFALTVEEHFGVLIPNAALQPFRTIGDVVTFVEISRAASGQQADGQPSSRPDV